MTSPHLFGAIDMGTNSFKLLIVEARPNGRFLPVLRRKDPVVLGRDPNGGACFSISDHSIAVALDSLRGFRSLLDRHRVAAANTRCVATAAVRSAANAEEFARRAEEVAGVEVEVLSGDEEARLAYLCSLQFFPSLEDHLTLCIDLGGGSTELAIGARGTVLFASSLPLGHVSLTETFRNKDVEDIRLFVRSVMAESGLVENVRKFGFNKVVGTSGTIRALEKAVFHIYGGDSSGRLKLNRVGLRGIIARLLVEDGSRERFFKKRSEFIVAGAVLLEEIFEAVEVEEMEVSGFALVDGVVANTLSGADEYDLGANARWRSAVSFAARFNGKRRTADAANCAGIAKEIFEELRKRNELGGVLLEVKDLEYLEVACLLHNIGHFIATKGYHKQSYNIIMNSGHLHGYRTEEVTLIALLARHHIKKFPKLDHSSFKELSNKVQKKFKFLCAILRVSIALWQHRNMNVQIVESSHSCEGFDFKSVFKDLEDQNLPPRTLTESENKEGLRQELEYFKMGGKNIELIKSFLSWTIFLSAATRSFVTLVEIIKNSKKDSLVSFGMGLEEKLAEMQVRSDETLQSWKICKHAFSDLTYVSPVVFLSLLKECYIHGTCKATKKFRALQQQVLIALQNRPIHGPAVFVLQCLYLLPMFGLYSEGLSHLIISSLRRYLKLNSSEDLTKAKDLAAQLFLNIVGGSVEHDEGVLLKILEAYDVQLINIEKVMCPLKKNDDYSIDTAKFFVEQYIFRFIEAQSYMNAVTLLEHFSIRQSGEAFLLSMMQINQFKAAEKWATFMGKSLLCVLVQEYIDRNMLNGAYQIIKKNSLRQDFPEIYHKCKESSLKKLAEKGCWEVAEAKTNQDRQLLEYLVYLAMEAGYTEKVDELCDRYSLEGFLRSEAPDASLLQSRYLNLDELVVEDIVWVDEVDGLRESTCHIEESKVVGLDCEWKPNYIKGVKGNKVSIMQIASDRKVFILDLIKLSKDAPEILDSCLSRILQSPRILKLGYNFQCDIKQLAHSYGELGCFKHYEMLLDIQNVFKEPNGGLSGLAKKILGAGLNKTRRNSNWEQRPLTQNQLEYAALDAVVLIHIFRHVRNHSTNGDSEGHEKIEWKSYILSHMDNPKKPKSLNRKSLKTGKKAH